MVNGIKCGPDGVRADVDGDPALAEDPALKLVEPARRGTLLAKCDAKGVWHLPIHLGGAQETVFFDF